MYRSSIQAFGGDDVGGPDYLYYNADIINNTTDDQAGGLAVQDPNIVFNETRDAALIKDASDYFFSIVRFSMNGPNKDLPLFIPVVQTGTGQTNVDLTTYAVSVPLQTFWTSTTGETFQFNTIPEARFVQYQTETKNLRLAPIPNTLAAQGYKGIFNALTQYKLGDIIASTVNVQYGNGGPPYYQVRTPSAWSPSSSYQIGSWVLWAGVGYTNSVAIPFSLTSSNPPPSADPSWNPDVPVGTPVTDSRYWSVASATLGVQQDLSTRYYWVYTYQHWLDLVNETIVSPADLALSSTTISQPQSCMGDLFYAFLQDWQGSGITDPFPFLTVQDFINYLGQPPKLVREGNKFVLYGDSDVFGARLEPFTAGVPPPYDPVYAQWDAGTTYSPGDKVSVGAVPWVAVTPVVGVAPVAPAWVSGTITPTATLDLPPVMRLFFNSNMYGLFTNFENTYWNLVTSKAGDGLLDGLGTVARVWDPALSFAPGLPVVFTDPLTGKRGGYYPLVPTTPGNAPTTNSPVQWAPNTAVCGVPLGYVNQILFPNKFYQNVVDYRLPPYSGTPPLGYVPLNEQKPYWRIEQEQPSDDSLWSPIGSIVFTSTLLPVKAEQVGPPVQLGAGNIGNSTATAQSAFQPIITDIALDTSVAGAGAYRSLIYYAPLAEYRLSDFGASKQPIRNVDVQVFWKCRLNSQLYPVQMFNLSSVSFKMMFKKKGMVGKAERTTLGL